MILTLSDVLVGVHAFMTHEMIDNTCEIVLACLVAFGLSYTMRRPPMPTLEPLIVHS